jgi:adenylyltransferase/sulfurtransferase
MTARDYQLLHIRYSCPLLSREQILEGKVPTAPTIASMMGALEVQEALKILHGMPVEAGSALVFNGVSNGFYRTKLPRRDDCLSHESYPPPERVAFTSGATAGELMAEAARSLGGPGVLALERDVVTAVSCPTCGWTKPIHRARTAVKTSEAMCPNCREPARPARRSTGRRRPDRRRRGLGLPPPGR